jgi:hypothetical protein
MSTWCLAPPLRLTPPYCALHKCNILPLCYVTECVAPCNCCCRRYLNEYLVFGTSPETHSTLLFITRMYYTAIMLCH